VSDLFALILIITTSYPSYNAAASTTTIWEELSMGCSSRTLCFKAWMGATGSTSSTLWASGWV
jgi:hypothetical protein